MKNNKLISSILTGTIILTSATALLDNSSFAEAKRINGRTGQKSKEVVKTVTITNADLIRGVNEAYKQNLIDETTKNEIISRLSERIPGVNKIQWFKDLAFDVYISGPTLAALAMAGDFTANFILNEAIGKIPGIGSALVSTITSYVNTHFSNDFLRSLYYNGVIFYCKLFDNGIYSVQHWRYQ